MAEFFNIGTLDTLVTIRKCIITSGRQGGKSYTFTDYSTVYANVDLRVNEQVNEGNLEQGEFINLTIYKIPELTTRWQVSFGGRIYEITAIDPISRLSPVCTLSLHDVGAAPEQSDNTEPAAPAGDNSEEEG